MRASGERGGRSEWSRASTCSDVRAAIGGSVSNKVEDDMIARLDAKRRAERGSKRLQEAVDRVMAQLTPREHEVLEERFGVKRVDR